MKTAFYIFSILILFSCSRKKENADVNLKEAQKINSDTVHIDPSETESKIVKLERTYKFEDYKVNVFNGKLAEPDFKRSEFANDSEYVEFIQSGCRRNGVNFGGHFTIIERSCGALCSSIFIVDRINGRIFERIKPDDGRFGYKYKIDSTLLIANSEAFTNDEYTEYSDFFDKPEFYIWKKDNFVRLD